MSGSLSAHLRRRCEQGTEARGLTDRKRRLLQRVSTKPSNPLHFNARDYESRALPLSYLAVPKAIAHSKGGHAVDVLIVDGDQGTRIPLSGYCASSSCRDVCLSR